MKPPDPYNDTMEDTTVDTTVETSCQTEMTQISNYNYKCEICDIACKHVKGITDHVKNKHNGKIGFIDFICEYCGQIFKSNTEYKMHLIQAHNVNLKEKIVSLKCKGCDADQSLEELMHKHVEMEHEHWKFYDCELCGYGHELGDYLKNYLQKIIFHEED